MHGLCGVHAAMLMPFNEGKAAVALTGLAGLVCRQQLVERVNAALVAHERERRRHAELARRLQQMHAERVSAACVCGCMAICLVVLSLSRTVVI